MWQIQDRLRRLEEKVVVVATSVQDLSNKFDDILVCLREMRDNSKNPSAALSPEDFSDIPEPISDAETLKDFEKMLTSCDRNQSQESVKKREKLVLLI